MEYSPPSGLDTGYVEIEDTEPAPDAEYITGKGRRAGDGSEEGEQCPSLMKHKARIHMLGLMISMIYLCYVVFAVLNNVFTPWSLLVLIPTYWCSTYKDDPCRYEKREWALETPW
jgi:hypothetical protein